MPTAQAPSQVPSRSLPPKASEEFLRKEAKRLAHSRRIQLAAAQRELAREYGHRNWAGLVNAAKATIGPTHTSVRRGVDALASAGAPPLGDDEWSRVIALADVSISEMPFAPSQQEWLKNRQSFVDAEGVQQYFVAKLGDRTLGFACAEHPPVWMRNRGTDAAGEYRLFLVVAPEARRTLGARLLARLRDSLVELGAQRAWFQEYEQDAGLIAFLREKGFRQTVSFKHEGTSIVRLCMDAPFASLAQPARRTKNSSAA